ncbi:RelA/SpoT domain-containing protein [Rhodoferax sp.]|uniref:RelA/SpoT domain-containing protein n=1 Tax=Rhodoferax sp. TaxID=50421 RepID=UPI0025D8F527|nr:RelA/SpoT domain-containing protein [Rhodoferax sp.]
MNRAGANVRAGIASEEDHSLIQVWRAAHRPVLNTFQSLLRMRTRETTAKVAQRLKRKSTIYDKLQRERDMQLARMDDIAGCRIIFRSIKQLRQFRKSIHEARFNHQLRHAENPDKYDYIARPKPTGYRGIHDIYVYDVNSESGAGLKGLYVEIQYRTLIQHAWATAVEIVGVITDSQPKFQKGDPRITDAMSYASEILARAHESMTSAHPEMPDEELVRTFLALDGELGLLESLRRLNKAKAENSESKNFILDSAPDGSLEVHSFRDATEALRKLFQLEQEKPGNDIVLVRADSTDDVRLAFRNYFQDAREFVRLVETGCARLSGRERE